MRILWAILICALCVTACSASEIGLQISPVAQDVLPGYRTYDVHVSTSGQLTGLQMLLETTEDGIYQDPFGGRFPPSNLFFDLVSTLEYDTYVGLGGATSQTSISNIIVPGGAVNLGGEAAATFSDSKLNITWAPSGATPIFDPADYFVARVTLADSAHGLLRLLGSTFNGTDITSDLYIFPRVVQHQPIESTPSPGSTISLQPVLDSSVGVLSDAISLFRSDSAGEEVIPVGVGGVRFTANDFGLFSAAINPNDPSSIDLMMDETRARNLRVGTTVVADLIVDTELGESLEYRLTATIIPEPVSLSLAIISGFTAVLCFRLSLFKQSSKSSLP